MATARGFLNRVDSFGCAVQQIVGDSTTGSRFPHRELLVVGLHYEI